ncbi:MAG: hypothetical protein AAB929_02915 [Patescibacteria group bacterium]
MSETAEVPSETPIDPIVLSHFTSALLDNLKAIKPRMKPDDVSKIYVSQTVSLVALIYEKIRNAIEYREDHLIRRAAIERIIKRRLMLNPEGRGEAENVLREVLWARYFSNGSLGGQDLVKIQVIIDKYIFIKKTIITGRDIETQQYLAEFLIQMLTCEIEETLSPEDASQYSSFTFFIYQVMRKKIKIEGLSDDQRDAYFLAALERAYRKSDMPYQRYHLFITFYKPVGDYSMPELKDLSNKLPKIFLKIDETLSNSFVDSLMRYTRKQLPSFLILFSVINDKYKEIMPILGDKNKLWSEVEQVCREKYQQLSSRVRTLAVRSFIYIFLTKMIFALILEVPVSKYIYGDVNLRSVIINSVFPPILMLLIVSFFKVPGEDNTKNIFNKIVNIIDRDTTFETSVSYIPKKPRVKKPMLIFGFTIFYTLTFMVTLSLIYEGLSYINFNLISMSVFVFFVSIVSFFSYRIRQIVNLYRLEEKEGVLTPIIDFFFMPILSLGKFFSGGLARLNFLIFVFDFLIEAPFKLIFEVVEEWISFVRKRKDEII